MSAAMVTVLIDGVEEAPCLGVSQRGYVLVYRPDIANFCPACAHANWYVGRTSAECAFCATALPIAAPARGLAFRDRQAA